MYWDGNGSGLNDDQPHPASIKGGFGGDIFGFGAGMAFYMFDSSLIWVWGEAALPVYIVYRLFFNEENDHVVHL